MTFVKRLPILMATLTAFAGAPASAAEESVNVYSYRQPTLIQPLLEAFSKNTGIKVNFIFAEKGLVERMVQEGRNSPADVLLTADVGRLVDATSRGLSSPLNEASINDNIPANLRDPDGNWFGLTMRARVAYVAKARVSDTSLSYEDLALPKWKGKVCLRSGQHAYNLGLIAAMIAHKGDAKTKEWLQGLRGNLIGKPNGNDRSQAKSVHAGECDVAIANTYYMGKMLTNAEEPEQQQRRNRSNRLSVIVRDGHTREHLGHATGQKRPQSCQRGQTDELSGQPGSAAAVRRGKLRVSCRLPCATI